MLSIFPKQSLIKIMNKPTWEGFVLWGMLALSTQKNKAGGRKKKTSVIVNGLCVVISPVKRKECVFNVKILTGKCKELLL